MRSARRKWGCLVMENGGQANRGRAERGQAERGESKLSQAEAFARIRLLRSPRIGPVSYHQLLARFGNAVAALEALPELGSRGKRRYAPAPIGKIESEI